MLAHRPPDESEPDQGAQNQGVSDQFEGQREGFRNAGAVDRLESAGLRGCVRLRISHRKNVRAFREVAVVGGNHFPRNRVRARPAVFQADAIDSGIRRIGRGIGKIGARAVGRENGNAGDARLDAFAEMDLHFGRRLRENGRCRGNILNRRRMGKCGLGEDRNYERETKYQKGLAGPLVHSVIQIPRRLNVDGFNQERKTSLPMLSVRPLARSPIPAQKPQEQASE